MKVSTQIKVALFAAIIAVSAQIFLPMPGGVPFTLQIYAVALTSYMLGRKNALIAVLIYLALGAVGAPVFSGLRGGVHILLGLTGGFLIGFIPFSLILNRKWIYVVLAVFTCHLCGVLWFFFLSGGSILSAFLASSAPYILKDFLSVFLARLTYNAIIKRI